MSLPSKTALPEWPHFDPTDGPLEVLCKLSRYYGGDPSLVLAGGGSMSCKISDRLCVNAGGTSLATITPDGFVAMNRARLDQLAGAELSADPVQREAQFQAAIAEGRCEPQRNQRPSVEVLLHHLVPGTYVVHSHATVASALTCHTHGQQLAAELFGDDVLWLPYVDPGFMTAQKLKRYLARRTAVKAILMANHGWIVAGDDPETIRRHTEEVLHKIESRLGDGWRSAAFGKSAMRDDSLDRVRRIAPALRGLLAEPDATTLKVVTCDDSELARSVVGTSAGKAAACAGPVTPDQIVYCNSFPLWIEPQEDESEDALVERLRAAIDEHRQRTRFPPKIVLVGGVGLFAVGDDYAEANTTRLVYLEAAKAMAGATRLGGVNHLAARDRQVIEDGEIESRRKQVAAAAPSAAGRVRHKVAVVTGAAQGFGLEISRGLAAQGAHVVLADLNKAGAKSAAAELCREHGSGRAVGLPVDVTDGESIRQCLDQVVNTFGGFDVFISNAGVLKAESVKTQPEQDFDFVTAVNYKGYFLCVQQAAPLLATQHRAAPKYRSDVIQINSKSGLAGSRRNFAYAGSKFGGIGLTQSFALELIEDGVKVNAICPGNFFDGPLWSDPHSGLFVQYLRAGKVPGAETIDDVRRFYEAKVPMGRGCRAEDVITAILYVIDQHYETGQAIPVTGGQEMLR